MGKSIVIGSWSGGRVEQLGVMSNRHGLVAGATGTGKTVTLQVLAEGFARVGTPVFAADVKGDLSGISQPGRPHSEVDRRLATLPGMTYTQRGYPTVFWDIFGASGHRVRTTISEMGPLILGNLLELNETQTGILYAAFAIADDEGMLLLDLKDLRSMLSWMAENAKELRSNYGNISVSSVGAIERRLMMLEQQGAEEFYGEPALKITDLMQRDFNGNGVISLLSADKLLRESPRLYSAFLLWLLSELFEELPEAGDLEVPKLVLFFDEAHLLFKGMPKSLLDKIEQAVRLIRSKGVGIYFVTQNPMDIPEAVLGQVGMKIQHALRAFTPRDQKNVRAIAQGFRSDGELDVASVVTELGVGEALVSALEADGSPGIVRKTLIRPPESQIGPVDASARTEMLDRSPMQDRYDTSIDRESAYEILAKRAEQAVKREAEEEAQEAQQKAREAEQKLSERKNTKSRRSSGRQGIGEAMLKSAARSVGRSLGSRLIRGLLGSLLK